MKIGDKVKYYFSIDTHCELRTGVIVDFWYSSIFKNKKRYGAKDDLGGFIHAGYREDFEVIKNV